MGEILDSLKDGVTGIIDDTQGILRTPTGTIIGGAVASTAIIGTGIVTVASIKSKTRKRSTKRKTRVSKSKRKTNKRKKRSKRSWKLDRAKRSKQKWEIAYQKRKKNSKSKSGIHYTKNGQPYKILSNGRARFIKKRR